MDARKWIVVVFAIVAVSIMTAESATINITLLDSGVAQGAVCLDGTPPAYFYAPGSGTGANNWIVHMEGGGWCETVASCVTRMGNFRGSSNYMEKTIGFSGILSSSKTSNPDFYNWNRVKVKYCDGSSFTGDIEAVDPSNNLHFRGARVWQAIVNELLSKGMNSAQNAILSGCSAGGLASILHCDKFQSLLPSSANVKCVSDAGYFIHGKDVSGGYYIEQFFSQVVNLHGSANNLPSSCTSTMKPELCFFPQYVAQTMGTPLFIINAAFDSWQIKNILAPSSADPSGVWKSCKANLTQCTASQLQVVQDYRTQFLDAVSLGGNQSSKGTFIDSCYVHCQSGDLSTWMSDGSTQVGGKKMATAVGDWFYGRAEVKLIDCPDYGCNPTCKATDSSS